MKKGLLSRERSGFTLVELLIVVIILAILAAIVVPQFATSTDDAKDAALDSTLANIRDVLDLYFAQHGEYPAGLPDGKNAAGTEAAFISQLSLYTDVRKLALISKIAEPAMLLVMGAVVGILVSSLILPIFQLSRAVG